MRKNLLIILTVAIVGIFSFTRASALTAGFNNQLITGGLTLPTDFAFAPDGRVFITEQNGQIIIFKNNQLLSTPALALSVGSGGDRGLLSLALDPNFSANGFIYLLYTPPALHERISRFTMAGDTINPASEAVLLENPRTWSGFLNAGALRFGPGGKLYASMGSDGTGTGAQDLSTYDGKFFRINSDGTIPADNPFVNTPGAVKAIYAYGLRNPWRFNISSAGTIYVGDVGVSTFDKIEQITSGGNYGWPTFEGDCTPNCNGVIPPILTLPHNGAGMAVVGGDFNPGGNFPAAYAGNYFFGDFVQGYIKNFSVGNPAGAQTFDTGDGNLSAINFAPDGTLWYAVISTGELHKISFGGAILPTAAAIPDKNSGNLPLTVNFSSSGSTGSNLSYNWNFGDGSTSASPNPAHTFTVKGIYNVVLTVTNANGSANTSVKIWAGYLPPQLTITAPTNNGKYNDGNTINYSGNATDPQDGTLSGNSLQWGIILHENTHQDPPITSSGPSGTFLIPNVTDEPTATDSYEFDLTATDSFGLSSTATVFVFPNMSNLNFLSNPTGAQLLLDSTPIATPYSQASVVGLTHTLGVNSPQNIAGASFNFTSWSNNGSQNQTITTPGTDATFTANFTASPPSGLTFTDTEIPDQTTYSPGAPGIITGSVTSNQNNINLLLDMEIYSSSGTKTLQNIIPLNIAANTPFISTWNFTTPSSPDTYKVKLGVFQNDWSKLYYWDDNANSFIVNNSSPPPGPLAFVVSADLPSNNFSANAQSTVTTNITATGNVPNSIIDTEVYNSTGTKVLQNVVPTSLLANQIFTSSWPITLPGTSGTYTVKVGVFSSNWATVYFWQNNAFQFTIGTPPGSPQPGVTYPITILQPTNNSTVTGLVEIRSVISGLDINTYNIGWRTGTGAFFNLDTDPVTQSFKHAWIDFTAWTWMPNHIYSLEFQATTTTGTVIGDQIIQVVH